MKTIICILLLCASSGIQSKRNYRAIKLLSQLNDARAMVAAGVLRPIQSVLKMAGLENEILKIPPMGPVPNMYKLRWSRELESEARAQLKSVKWLYGSIKTDKYRGFYYKYTIGAAVRNYMRKQNRLNDFSIFESKLVTLGSVSEVITFIIWLGLKYPKSLPADDLIVVEAFVPERFEIGCAFNDYTVCMLRDTFNGTSNGQLFEEGVACTECPTWCEFSENDDGSVEEEDLCVPPR
uniref:Uncharacterized protein n=1 Tax=Caenorhabditis japonica TaxID=281687 RepID=A0A8R1I4M0_CAEJA